MSLIDTSVYIHIPFCKSKCIYCDYNSVYKKENIETYIDYIVKEIKIYSDKIVNRSIKTIYIGGGTPNYINSKLICKVLNEIYNSFNCCIEEITIEMNPEFVSKEQLNDFKTIGINRISLGFQNLNDEILSFVKRLHSKKIAINSFVLANKYFDNINVDFILGLPLENKKTVLNNLDFIKEYYPKHISYYRYDNSFETPLKILTSRNNVLLPENDFLDYMDDLIKEKLIFLNYNHYEISSFALFDNKSKHNMSYWLNSDYIGFGLSAGGYYNRYRYTNVSSFDEYYKKLNNYCYPIYKSIKNSNFQDFKETLFMGLRILDGINIENIRKKYNNTMNNYLDDFINDNYKYINLKECISLNKLGIDYNKRIFEYIACMEE